MVGDQRSLSPQEQKQLEELFARIDVNKDGKVCIDDLVKALEESHGQKNTKLFPRIAQNFLSRCGVATTGELTFQQFVSYVLEHDKKLVIAFNQLDESHSGRIGVKNVQNAFKRFGMPLEYAEAERLLKRVDQAGTLTIDYREWREFLLFHPAEDLSNIFKFWRHDAFIDVGSDAAVGIPEDFSTLEVYSGRHLLQLGAGAIAGAVSRTCTAPIDRLKLMRQVYGYKHKGSGFTDAYRYMIREGGFWSLWRGNGINVLKIAPETSLKYFCYDYYKSYLQNVQSTGHGWLSTLLDDRPLLTKFLAGSMAGSTAQTIIYPLEVLKTRMCLRKTGQFNSIWDCARSVFKENSLLAFYRGYGVNLLGIIPYAGIELALYERCKVAYINQFMLPKSDINSSQLNSNTSSIMLDPTQHPPSYVIPILAAFASACGIIATYPAALVRAKLQAQYRTTLTRQKVTAISLLRTILREDGPYGLYRGMGTNLAKVLPAVGISLATYEALRHKLNLGPLGSG